MIVAANGEIVIAGDGMPIVALGSDGVCIERITAEHPAVQFILAACNSHAAALRIAKDHIELVENLEDRAPMDARCGSCTSGAGPHYELCGYHAALRMLKGAE